MVTGFELAHMPPEPPMDLELPTARLAAVRALGRAWFALGALARWWGRLTLRYLGRGGGWVVR